MHANPTPEEMVQDLWERGGVLTDWEEDFLQSIADRLDHDEPLTETQYEKLRQIWEDKA